jgi:hypothetical protein
MFGGEFGAFRSRERHFFNEDAWVYQELAKILAVRRAKIGLRRGRQYLREISGDGVNFGLPRLWGNEMRSIVPWSRLFDDGELLLAINTDPDQPLTAWCQVESSLHQPGKQMECHYSTDASQVGGTLEVQRRGERLVVQLSVPAAGFVIYESKIDAP